ncbi:LacI family DNA-binding transcriptional regulator [Comamonas piscis]|uniref:LacI family DNA-binding transcriptional regulator n=1 Tax=Comamonas piscis TaxID=1562974 RepID=UPI001EE1AACB|nr:LacI family DNA-binding transcriptional regulator [Comamonas piscis]WSO34527.1 LacI family DNA-binding transcriptional regulator [Comamonas piscis]
MPKPAPPATPPHLCPPGAAKPAAPAKARATIADVALAAQVSKATVSRYLNGRTDILTPDMAKRVQEAIASLQYRPSPMAQALKHGRTRLIGLAVADVTNPFSVAVLQGAEKACQAAGYLLVLFNLGNEAGRERDAMHALSAYQLDGMILNRVDTSAQLWQDAQLHGKPIVLVDRFQEGLDADFVTVDNPGVIQIAMDHLQQQGFDEVLLVTEPIAAASSRTARQQAFARYLQSQATSMQGSVWESTPDSANAIALQQQLQQWRDKALQAGRHPAVLAGNAVASLRVATAVHALGWVPGRELGIIGVDETDWAALVGPGLSTVAQPTDALGQAAATCLIERIQGLQSPARIVELPGTIIVRGSTKSPNH